MTRFLAGLVLLAGVAHAQCPGDVDGDGRVTVNEIVSAVDAGLNGCGERGGLYRLAGTSWHVLYGDSRSFADYAFDGAPRPIGDQLRLAGSNTTSNRRVGLEETASGSVILTEVVGSTCVLTELRWAGNELAGTALAYTADCGRVIDSTVTAVHGFPRD